MVMYPLKQNHGCDIPKDIVALDIETFVNRGPKQSLRHYEILYSRRWKDKKEELRWTKPVRFSGDTVEGAWQALDDIGAMVRRGRIWLAGHNIAFDWIPLHLDDYVGREGWTKLRPFNITKPFLVYAKRGDVKYCFISTTNLYPDASLRELAPYFGMVKLGEDLVMDRLDSYPDSLIVPYCLRDAEIVLAMMQQHSQTIREEDMGTFKPTIAGQAFNFWTHRYMPPDRVIRYDSKRLIDLEREAYRGGRCEAFHIGDFKQLYKLDFHSMYPYAMKSVLYPCEPLSNRPVVGMDSMQSHIDAGDHVVADCLLELKKPVIAVKRDKKMVSPVGKVRAVIDSCEIEYLQAHPEKGRIVRVPRFVPYRNDDIGFGPYVDYWYERKLKADKKSFQYLQAKLMMNALYGKLGQRMYGEMKELSDEEALPIITSMESLDHPTKAIKDIKGGCYYQVGDKVLFRPARTDEYSWSSVPRIPAKVCSMGRMRLQMAMDAAGDGHYYYCDTDSLFVDSKGLENLEKADLVHDSELGKMGIEDGPEDGHINKPKDYRFGEEVKRKGVKKDAVEIRPNVFQQRQFVTGLQSYWNGDRDGVLVKTVTKDLNDMEYTKGSVGKDGWVSPWVYHEW